MGPTTMLLAHISPTPLEGAAWSASEAFRQAGYDSFCIAPAGYDSGRAMPTDYRWPPMGGAVARLHQADLVFCHGFLPAEEPWWPVGRAIVGWAYSEDHCRLFAASGNSESCRHQGNAESCPHGPGIPWGASALLPEAGRWGATPLPDLLPLEHRFFRVGPKAVGRVRIACRPPSRHDDLALAALRAATAAAGAELDVIAGLSFEETLRRFAAAHVFVADLAAGLPGRPALEALALGCVALGRLDPAAAWPLQRVCGGCLPPIEQADPVSLGEVLARLTALGPAALTELGLRGRRWIEEACRPAALIERCLRPLMEVALGRGARCGGARARQGG